MGLSAAGVTISMLGATAITAATKGGVHGALWTGAFLVVMFAAKAVFVLVVPAWSDRLGPERLFFLAVTISIIVWASAGILVVIGVPGTVVVLVVAPMAGAMNAVFAVETPLLSKAFLVGHSIAAANSRVAVARGIACSVGALGGGLLINFAGAGWALIARSFLAIPLLLIVRKIPFSAIEQVEHKPISIPAVDGGDLLDETARPSITEDPAVRRVILLAVTLTIATAPMVAMIVPIAQSLRQTPLVLGASIMLSAIAAGELLAPPFTRFFGHRGIRRGDALETALVVTGSALIGIGVVSVVLTARLELVAWVIIGLFFGGAEGAAHSTVLGELVAAAGTFDSRRAIASLKFATNVATPIGLVLWAVLIETTNGAVTILTAAILMSATALVLRRRSLSASSGRL